MARIILIEDDDLIRETTAELLELRGHEVAVSAATAAAALSLSAAAAADLAIVDYSLPDMDGAAAALRLRELFPAIPVVISSGRRFDSGSLEIPPPVFFLQKPYGLEALDSMLGEALSAPPR